MKKSLLATVTIVLSLGIATATFAPSRDTTKTGDCSTSQTNCNAKQGKSKSAATTKTSTAPKAGDSGKSGTVFTRAKSSRVTAAPSGQEYRVVKNYLVLTHTGTGKIAKVVGPIADYAK